MSVFGREQTVWRSGSILSREGIRLYNNDLQFFRGQLITVKATVQHLVKYRVNVFNIHIHSSHWQTTLFSLTRVSCKDYMHVSKQSLILIRRRWYRVRITVCPFFSSPLACVFVSLHCSALVSMVTTVHSTAIKVALSLFCLPLVYPFVSSPLAAAS